MMDNRLSPRPEAANGLSGSAKMGLLAPLKIAFLVIPRGRNVSLGPCAGPTIVLLNMIEHQNIWVFLRTSYKTVDDDRSYFVST